MCLETFLSCFPWLRSTSEHLLVEVSRIGLGCKRNTSYNYHEDKSPTGETYEVQSWPSCQRGAQRWPQGVTV